MICNLACCGNRRTDGSLPASVPQSLCLQLTARGHVAEDRKFAVDCKSGRSVVQVRSIEGELQQHAAAGLDDPPTVLSYLRFDEGAQMVLELGDKLAVGAERDAFGQGADLGLAQLAHFFCRRS